ncbi:hypothetical protein [Rhizobium leguminosarum]
MADLSQVVAGAVFERKHPFTWVEARQSDDPADVIERWRPGAWETTLIPPDDACAACHGEGTVKYTVISVHKPARYQTRVFFTRHFCDPEGGWYAPNKLHHRVMTKFLSEIEEFGFRYEVIEL